MARGRSKRRWVAGGAPVDPSPPAGYIEAVPEITDLDPVDVGNVLGLAGYTAALVEAFHVSIPAGQKISQVPAAGVLGSRGDLVTVTKSKGLQFAFAYTGAVQTFVVPDGVSTVAVELLGAGGTDGGGPGAIAGKGARVLVASLPVTPGETLGVYVGGSNGWNGGGAGGAAGMNAGGSGGGASEIRRGSTRLLIAGGGGGGGGKPAGGDTPGAGGNGGLTGTAGGNNAYDGEALGGGGATGSAGGAAGGGWFGSGVVGSANQGGAGGAAADGNAGGSGGGGGGLFGGGGGGRGVPGHWIAGAGGGGGSSYADAAATGVVYTAGYRTGDGLIIVSVM